MLLPNACRHPNRNGCFFWRPFEAKRCNNIELGERGHASFFAMSLTGWLFFLKNPDSVREIFFGLRMCKHKLEQIPFCTCHNPNPKIRSSSQLLLTNKECASTPPEAEMHKLCFAQCTYSARTVHGTVHATVHGHKMLQIPWDWCFVDNLLKIIKIFSFFVFSDYFWENTWYLQRFVAVYCDVYCSVHCVCTVRALCKTRYLCPLYFHQQNAAILLLEVCRHILR